MVVIHYFVSRETDLPIETETFDEGDIEDAAAHARARIRAGNRTIPGVPSRQNAIGFAIFDATEDRLLHREYLELT